MNEITDICKKILKDELKKTFDKWVERMKLFLEYEGDYFEHFTK